MYKHTPDCPYSSVLSRFLNSVLLRACAPSSFVLRTVLPLPFALPLSFFLLPSFRRARSSLSVCCYFVFLIFPYFSPFSHRRTVTTRDKRFHATTWSRNSKISRWVRDTGSSKMILGCPPFSPDDRQRETRAGGAVPYFSPSLCSSGFLLPLPPLALFPPLGASLLRATSSIRLRPTNQEIPPRIEDARALLPTERRRQPRART